MTTLTKPRPHPPATHAAPVAADVPAPRAGRVLLDGDGPSLAGVSWVADTQVAHDQPRVVAYRLRFNLDEPAALRLHVSADERYELWLDGHRIGRGSERGAPDHWFFESYDVSLEPGPHTLVARTWWLGPHGPAPYAQMSVRHAFLLFTEGDLRDTINTGTGGWECRELGGYEWLPPGVAWGCGAKVRVVGDRFAWGFESDDAPEPADNPAGEVQGEWRSAVIAARATCSDINDQPRDQWRLRPAVLPPMVEQTRHLGVARVVDDAANTPFHDDPYKHHPPFLADLHLPVEARAWDRLLRGDAGARVTIAPHTRRRVLIDLGDYHCAYPELVLSGGRGGVVRVSWAESLYERLPSAAKKEWIGHMPKGHRDAVEGKFFHGVTDEFLPDGGEGRRFDTLWWEAGRFICVRIAAGDEPLHVDALRLRVTHYPFDFESRFESSDGRLAGVERLALRTLRMGTHEVYTDCPYYEQIMYVGDTRLQALVTYATSRDARLPRKALGLLDASRLPDGMVQSRYPSRVNQHTWGFNLWWVAMVHDWVLWRGVPEALSFARDRLPGVRAAIDAALRFVGPDGLVRLPTRPNFNFVDWAPQWHGPPPPPGEQRNSGVYGWHLVHVLKLAAELEDWLGEPELAALHRRRADTLATRSLEAYWDEPRGVLADDPDHRHFSEHSQVLAILGDALPDSHRGRAVEGLLADPDLTRTTVYFSHYLFEALRKIGHAERFVDRLEPWFAYEKLGLRTLPEMPEPTRSDCHAWGSHPVYHFYATVLGIRPVAPGMSRVEVRPVLGSLEYARGDLVHPAGGFIHADLRRQRQRLVGSVVLPPGVTGTLHANGHTVELGQGRHELR